MNMIFMLAVLSAVSLIVWFVMSRVMAYWDGRDDASLQCKMRESWPETDEYENKHSGQRAALYDQGFRDGVRAYGRIRGNRKRFYGQGEENV